VPYDVGAEHTVVEFDLKNLTVVRVDGERESERERERREARSRLRALSKMLLLKAPRPALRAGEDACAPLMFESTAGVDEVLLVVDGGCFYNTKIINGKVRQQHYLRSAVTALGESRWLANGVFGTARPPRARFDRGFAPQLTTHTLQDAGARKTRPRGAAGFEKQQRAPVATRQTRSFRDGGTRLGVRQATAGATSG